MEITERETEARQHQYYNWKTIGVKKRIAKKRNAVYLAIMENKKEYAIKVFPYEDNYYISEASFSDLIHENIIAPSFTGETSDSGKKFSLIFYDYCKYGDLHKFIVENQIFFTEKMTRTYFRQLVEAIEYMHNKKIVHNDLKPENLFIDENFRLKVGDFDLTYRENKETKAKGGTINFFAPEQAKKDFDPYKSEYFTMGIVLFNLSTGCRAVPYKYPDYKKYRKLLEKKPQEFWSYFQNFLEWPYDRWSPEFKDLFMNLTWKDPNKRFNIKEMKKSKWYQGEVYSDSEVKVIFMDILQNKSTV